MEDVNVQDSSVQISGYEILSQIFEETIERKKELENKKWGEWIPE